MATYGVKLRRSDDLRLDEHPGSCSEGTFEAWCAQRIGAGERLAIDLFSGAGGLSLGLEAAGWTVAASVDNDPKALQTHRHNLPGLALNRDLGDPIERRSLIELLSCATIDLVAGGPPCQPFSRAGRSKIRSLVDANMRPENDLRRELWRAFLDVATQLKPRAILMENVPDMALSDDFRVIREMVSFLEEKGYHTRVNLIDAWRYGVPQHRKRLILLARRDVDAFDWPQQVAKQTTLADAISDLPVLDVENDDIGSRELPHTKKKCSPFANNLRKGMNKPVVWDHMTRPVRKDDREIFDHMTPGMLYTEVPERLRRYTTDTFDDKYNKLSWDDLCRTITAHIAKDGYWYIHPEQPRTLSVREAARIQTFPDKFRFAGTRSDAFRQIGNAVPPLLGEVAARAVAPGHCETGLGEATKWRDTRDALTHWAHRQRESSQWYLFPGPKMTNPVAVLVAMLIGGSGGSLRNLEAATLTIRGLDKLTARDLTLIEPYVSGRTSKHILERFRSLTRKKRIWTSADELAETMNMKPAQLRLFRLLCGDDVLLPSQGVVRVASRVAGTSSYLTNRMTDGRIDIARMVGSGTDAPLRTAALRILGSTICRETEPVCEICPLRAHCRTLAKDAPKIQGNQPSLLNSLDR